MWIGKKKKLKRSTDERAAASVAAPRVEPRWTPMWHPPSCVSAVSQLFYFLFFIFFLGFVLTRLRFNQNRAVLAESGCIGWIRCYRPAVETNKRPKLALNHAEIVEIGFEWGPNILNLSFLNFILNICCFFVFSFLFCFVLCFLPSSFFVLWIKAIVMCFLRIF